VTQLDWLHLDDNRAQLARLLEAAAERVGIAELAHQLHEDPSTLRNQFAHRERKRPSADAEALVYLLDRRYRHDKAAVCGEVLTRPADLTPEEALRELYVRAQAQGAVLKGDVADLMARTKRGDTDHAPLRVAP
jgi:hypothetical protein